MRFASSSSSSLQCLFAAATTTTETKMSSFRPYSRGGRNPYGRGFCNRPRDNGEPFVSGDSHLRSVNDANYGFRQGYGGDFSNPGRFQGERYGPPPNFRQPPPNFRQPPPNFQQPPPRFRQPPPNFRQPPPHFWQPPPHFRQPPPFHQPRPKPWDYRNWEYALSQPPSQCERFVVLSYNILANYLALDHRRELYYHIPPYILDWEWRRRKIVFELGLWSADIICLQEVDKFQDLENELKLHGYDGIWKMRTGKPVDGCAIFWRRTRFKLRHEEHIEYRNLGLRDNVAQICVFESMHQKPADNITESHPTSSGDANQVVICNIHVLYNPKRGEIKLGQVRELLNRAHTISKLWNDAPVVLCGDFNCTPKSPLYNFILEQKLNLDGLARDQISGQSSAEIKITRPYTSNPGQGFQRAQSPDNSVGTSILIDDKDDMKQNHILKMHNQPHPDIENSSPAENLAQTRTTNEILPHPDIENLSLTENLAQTTNEILDEPQKSQSNGRHDNENIIVSEATRVENEEIIDGSSIPFRQIRESPTVCYKESARALYLENDMVQEFTPLDGEKTNLESQEKESSYEGNVYCAEAADVVPVTIAKEEIENPSTSYLSRDGVNISGSSTCARLTVDQKLGNLSLDQQGEVIPEEGDLGQDHRSTFSSDRCSAEDVTVIHVRGCDDNFLEPESANSASDQSLVECTTIQDSELPPPIGEDDELSPSTELEPAKMERYVYDPSLWTPMEIETASGNADSTLLEHPLMLKSTYAEVEDYSGTRDPESKEPQVTSYNRRFLGTVDYIWCSEGLQTVKVLDTLPKQALRQWTTGFPTKKWGSDHIALASQLAFNKDIDRS